MNRVKTIAMLGISMLLASGAAAQETLRIYVAEDALNAQTAELLTQRLNTACAPVCWTLELESQTGESLRELVLSDRAPNLAVCTPKQGLEWAQEGMLLPLHSVISQQSRMQPQVLDCCVPEGEEKLFMAPLMARHRQMAVNVKRFQTRQLDYMLDETAHPVWYPTEFYQILEEFMMAKTPALEIWPAEPQTSAALETLVQSIFGGAFLSEDGLLCRINSPEIRTGLRWLADAVDSGLIGCAQSREEALQRFLSGETAMFLDWTPQEAERQESTLKAQGLSVMAIPYPSAIGLPVRAFELTGVCAFASGDARTDALAMRAAVLLHEDAQIQALLGPRGIWQDSAVWLPSLDAYRNGATLRSLFCGAMRQAMEDRGCTLEALEQAQAAMDALR